MKTAKLFIMGCMVAVLALSYSSSYAQKNDGTVFFSGRAGVSDVIKDCSGSCSANQNGTLELGLSSDWINENSDVFIYRVSPSVGYSQHQFDINGAALNVIGKGIYIQGETALRAYPRFVFVAKIEPTWKTASSLNMPDRTVFGVDAGVALLFQVKPGLYAIVGSTVRTISPANQPDFRYSTVDLGLRWYLF